MVEKNLFYVRGTARDGNSQGSFYFSRCTDVTVQSNITVFPIGQNIPAVEIRNSQPVTVEDNVFANAGETVLNTGSADDHDRAGVSAGHTPTGMVAT